MLADSFVDATAIIAVGWTDFTRQSGRSVLDLAAEASLRAIADAGLEPASIDGLVTSTWMHRTVAPGPLAHALGISNCNFQMFDLGGGRAVCSTVATAAIALHSRLCDAVLVCRAANARSDRPDPGAQAYGDQWSRTYGQLHAATIFGQHVSGTHGSVWHEHARRKRLAASPGLIRRFQQTAQSTGAIPKCWAAHSTG